MLPETNHLSSEPRLERHYWVNLTHKWEKIQTKLKTQVTKTLLREPEIVSGRSPTGFTEEIRASWPGPWE
jgi:hypothetical protein